MDDTGSCVHKAKIHFKPNKTRLGGSQRSI